MITDRAVCINTHTHTQRTHTDTHTKEHVQTHTQSKNKTLTPEIRQSYKGCKRKK